MKLPSANVHSQYTSRAPLQQNIGKPASRCPNVQAMGASHLDVWPKIQSMGEFQPAARHVRVGGLGCDLRIQRKHLVGFGHRSAICDHAACFNGRSGARSAFEKPLGYEQLVGALPVHHPSHNLSKGVKACHTNLVWRGEPYWRLAMIRSLATIAAATVTLAACAATVTDTDSSIVEPIRFDTDVWPIEAVIIGVEGNEIGEVKLVQAPAGVLGEVVLVPGAVTPGWHGLHIHQVGDCSDVGSFKMSGGHLGKIEDGHGLLNPLGPEAGDLPNIHAASDGSAAMEIFTTLTSLSEIADADGSALIIHQNRDDHLTQPIGGAGPRVGCAVLD